MAIYNEKILAAQKCIELGLPFALYSYPDEKIFHFVASKAVLTVSIHDFFDKSFEGTFAIAPFNPSDAVEIIAPELTPEDIETMSSHIEEIKFETTASCTSFDDYSKSGQKVIKELKTNVGKVVISRIIVAEGANPIDVALAYFISLPSTFRSLFYTPSKGLWLGATPELLATYSIESQNLSTMSLAGTRKINHQGEWDAKNIDEHNYVTDFIKDVLIPNSVTLNISPLFPLKYGEVEHLCEKIEAKGVKNIAEVIKNLSPTPAVCGTPRNRALTLINEAESHSRECYGGWIGVKTIDEVRTFVNLRCAKIIPDKKNHTYIYKVYAGGGFTADSIIEDEWEEAELKATPLLNVLKSSLRDG